MKVTTAKHIFLHKAVVVLCIAFSFLASAADTYTFYIDWKSFDSALSKQDNQARAEAAMKQYFGILGGQFVAMDYEKGLVQISVPDKTTAKALTRLTPFLVKDQFSEPLKAPKPNPQTGISLQTVGEKIREVMDPILDTVKGSKPLDLTAEDKALQAELLRLKTERDRLLVEQEAARKHKSDGAQPAGEKIPNEPTVAKEPIKSTATLPAAKSDTIFAKDSKLFFKDATGVEHAVLADYSKALVAPGGKGYLTDSKTITQEGKKYTLLKVFHTPDGVGDGELFLIGEDGTSVRFGFKSDSLEPKVLDGILSVPGTEREIELSKLAIEATRQSLPPEPLKDYLGNAIDPIPEAKSVFLDLTAKAKNNPQAIQLLPTHEAVIKNALRPAMAQDGGGNIAIYGKGGGKRTVAEAFVQGLVSGKYPEIPRTWKVMQLNAAALGTGTGVVGATQTREGAIVEFSKAVPTIWLAPDFEGLKGVGGGNGKADSLSKLAPHMEQDGTVRIIALVSPSGYTESIATDPALRPLFQGAEAKEPGKDEVRQAQLNWLKASKKRVPAEGTPEHKALLEALDDNYRISLDLDPINGQPEKALRLLKHIYARKVVDGEDAGLVKGDAEKSAQILYQADPSLFDPKLRGEKLGGLIPYLDENLVGLKYAKDRTRQGYANVLTNLSSNNPTPRNKTLFAGPPGTGKTATVELSAGYMKLPKEVLEMNNYRTVDTLEQFLYDVASKMRTNAFTVLIFDELEKAAPEVQAAALRMAQNGEFSARDSMEGKTSTRSTVQTTNASFEFTTNAGQDYVMDVYLGRRKYDEAEFRKVLVKGGINEPLLDRIDYVVPVMPFGRATFKTALEKAIGRFEKEYAASPNASSAPLNVTGKDNFVNQLIEKYFEPEASGGKPRRMQESSMKDKVSAEEAGGEHYLVNGRLVNRLIMTYLKDPVSLNRAMQQTGSCINVMLNVNDAGPNVME